MRMRVVVRVRLDQVCRLPSVIFLTASTSRQQRVLKCAERGRLITITVKKKEKQNKAVSLSSSFFFFFEFELPNWYRS